MDKALKWWDNLSKLKKTDLCDKYYPWWLGYADLHNEQIYSMWVREGSPMP